MNSPLDQTHRDRFSRELDRNFSIVASAGSGKTRAITDRIIAIATSPHALEWLPTLVVVTFTNRAADEMQQRARQRILEAGVPLEVLAAFQRAFFGTIHSFCVKLLRQHGHALGLPGTPDLLTDDDALWMEFLQQQTSVGASLDEASRRALLRLASGRELMDLGRRGGLGRAPTAGVFPSLDFAEVHAATGKGNARQTIAAAQARLQAWEDEWHAGDGFLPLPECGTKARDFVAVWEVAFEPLRTWRQTAARQAAAEIEEAYRRFRLDRAAINYDDQIALAGALLREPAAARRIREKSYRVILDEAQDTDPAQFEVLLEITRPPEATGCWLETRTAPPRDGHFCMVGDFQQSIFGERADLAHYRRVHDAILTAGAGEALEFSVTFRLDDRLIEFVNTGFGSVLHGADGQVPFVRLSARPKALPGQVLRCELAHLPDIDDWNDTRKARFEARQLAVWLRTQGLEKLRARAWGEVAILCPRKGWFPALHAALRAEGFAVQLQSERDLKGDSPAYAWFTALATIMAQPREGYEIVGVLREVFGVSDHHLATFATGRGERWQIAEKNVWGGVVGETLNLLAETRGRIVDQPLFSAMRETVRATQLPDRLRALPPEEFGDLSAELENLLTLAAAAEASGRTLAAFAEELRAGFGATREVRAAEPNAIQLITCHKAKGSEWPVVVLPFVGRKIHLRSGDYPRCLRHPQTGEILVALESADLGAEEKVAVEAEKQHELERLLYVALTRARHTLVLVDDCALFAGASGVPKNASARLLRCTEGEANATWMETLGADAVRCPKTAAEQAARSALTHREQTLPPVPPLSPKARDAARTRAGFFRKRNPSALAEAALVESDPAAYSEMIRRSAGLPNAGQRYGTWWHEFVERLDWSAGPKMWDAVFRKILPTAADPALAEHEWRLLRTQLTNGSALARALRGPGVIAHAEMPFLWAMNESECLDGIIDLAVFDPATESWLILDWKTNRVQEGELAKLHVHYRPQLSAYWQAATAMFAAPVTVGIYSTATGQWLPYEAGELATTWERLRRAPEELERALGES